MLAISPTASEAIKDLLAASELRDGGIRISNGQDGSGRFDLALAEEAAAGDEVVEEGGASVFLDEDIAEALEERTLDAQRHEGQIAFTIV